MKIAAFAVTVAALAIIAGAIFFTRPPQPTCSQDFLTSPLACNFSGETTK